MFLYYSLFVALIVIADQAAKYFTVLYIPAAGVQPFIPGLLQITYVRNTGAAFSSFEGQQWLFALIFLVLTGLIFWEYSKSPWALPNWSGSASRPFTAAALAI